MGNMNCTGQDTAHLAAVARDICPFPNYYHNPQYLSLLSVNSSLHLHEHYTSVQSSLSPKQLEDFTQSLRSTFGRQGRVSYGGVGVVALSLAILFDTVARQVKGEYVSDQEPIPGLFLKDYRGYYPPPVYTISKYLRLVPHIANNPTRMRQETERYIRKLNSAPSFDEDSSVINEDITQVNYWKCGLVGQRMKMHLRHISNETLRDTTSSENEDINRKFILNLNCDPKEASERFLAELHTYDNRTKEAFKNCKPDSDNQMHTTVIENIAMMNWLDIITRPIFKSRIELHFLLNQTGDFDLKANALGKWI